MKVWITQYALTKGIIVKDGARVRSVEDGTIITVPWKGGMNGEALFHGDAWHTSEREAIAKAETMRQRKIASLEKQLSKLSALRFGAAS